MFGYIIINKPEMKFKDYEVYHSFYCGLCRSLKSSYGKTGQMTLSFDMTFLLVLLSGLYEPETSVSFSKCIAHPFEKHSTRRNEFSSYVADMNLLLTYYKCMDDWEDEHKRGKYLFARALRKDVRKIQQRYPEKSKRIAAYLRQISADEADDKMDLDLMAGNFGRVMAEIFACRTDEWTDSLRKIGFYLGKFIYLCDAYEDIEEDIKNHNYNPLIPHFSEPDFVQQCRDILTLMMADCSREFELLPIIEYTDVLRNILYSGVWYRFELVTQKRMQQENRYD